MHFSFFIFTYGGDKVVCLYKSWQKKCKSVILKSYHKSIFYKFFYKFLFVNKIFNNISNYIIYNKIYIIYYRENKERLPKKARERYQNSSKEEK